jgi:hypothetical protein
MMCIMLAYNLFSTPYFGLRSPYLIDNFNLSKETEKKFMNDKRFNIPLQLFICLETICWVWALIVCSDKVKINHIWFNPDINSTYKYVSFTFLWGFFTGISAVCGHELVHKRETVNKAIGTWAYTKFFYTHFLDDHIAGHHKYIGTEEDVGTARKNETLYAFICRALYGAHTHTFKREIQRAQK